MPPEEPNGDQQIEPTDVGVTPAAADDPIETPSTGTTADAPDTPPEASDQLATTPPDPASADNATTDNGDDQGVNDAS
jgi:hypothetical protein